jgi:DNA-directed RNA polymerase subunit omega
MARITVEDCRHAVPNAFELVMLAAERARALGRGVAPLAEPEGDKRTVIALREIAEGRVDPGRLRADLIRRRMAVRDDEPEDEAVGDAFDAETLDLGDDSAPGEPSPDDDVSDAPAEDIEEALARLVDEAMERER